MGQTFSRRVVPRLEKLMERAEKSQVEASYKELEVKKAMASKQNHTFTDPNALIGGFRRGVSGPVSQSDLDQKKFLESQQVAAGSSSAISSGEMPDDLIKFLNDLGPIQKKVDSTLTSKRIMKEISNAGSDGEETYFDEEAKKMRESRRHRLNPTRPEFYSDGGDNANVTTRPSQETAKSNELKMTNHEIIMLLQQSDKKVTSSSDKKKDGDVHSLIRQYIGLPEFMVEDNKYVLAVWESQVPKFKKLGAKRL